MDPFRSIDKQSHTKKIPSLHMLAHTQSIKDKDPNHYSFKDSSELV